MRRLTQDDDRKRLKETDIKNLLNLLSLQIRNIWRVDGLYFQGIEKKFGVESARDIDKDVWRLLAKIEARNLKKIMGATDVNNIEVFMNLLLNTSWALYQTEKECFVSDDMKRGIFKVVSCKVQEARIKKSLDVFPCKEVRYSYLKSFAEELNPNIEVNVICCPPDKKPLDYWCGWEFSLKD